MRDLLSEIKNKEPLTDFDETKAIQNPYTIPMYFFLGLFGGILIGASYPIFIQ